MLGVQRPAVTVAVSTLERRGLTEPGRGAITIVDRTELKRLADGAYTRPDLL